MLRICTISLIIYFHNKKMYRIYICSRFTCFTYTTKMVLFTWLEHSANTNTLAIAPGRIKGGWVHTPCKFRTQESFEKIYYKCIPLYRFTCFESSFKAIESFIPVILPWGTLFLSYFPKYWYNFARENLLVMSTR